jgi:repressor LexA
MHEIQKKLLELIKENQEKKLGIRELQRMLGLKYPASVSHHLQQLEKKDYIRKSAINPSIFHLIEKKEDNFFNIPFYGKAQCGTNGRLLENNPEKFIKIPKDFLFIKNDKNLIAVKAKGDSMEPKISNNALIIAKNDSSIQNNDIIVCTYENEVLVKKYKEYPNNIYVLESFNPKFEPRYINNINEFFPVGKVIHILNTL